MNKRVLMVSLVLIVLLIGGYWVLNQKSATQSPAKLSQNQSPTTSVNQNSQDNARYIPYSPATFMKAAERKRVLFFHATWCPTCKVANQEFTTKANQIPNDVVLFKTDYDTYADLKQKYGITYQHTFVYVDKNGNEIKKWNGGDIQELITNTQ